MKNNLKISLGIATLALAAFAIAAGDPVGTWNGKLQIDMKKLMAQMEPMMKSATPAQKAQFTEQMKKVADVTLLLKLNKDKTATIRSSAPGAKEPPKDATGTWSLSGSQVSVKMAGKGTNNPPLVLKLSADGKSMTGDIPGMNGGGSQGKMTFKKA